MDEDPIATLNRLHTENIARITSLEHNMLTLQNDTAEIVDWVRNAKLGGKILTRVCNFFGRVVLHLIRFIGVIAMIGALYASIKSGKIPDILKFYQ